ncbi:putative pentatricopeptide repeat-containing protein At3g13770, mitochondrial [Coffea arabica]|uniref:Pentatricopeptide repeat-containing protein At3g13770, mitochondrial n=1 Tax=Coffea arabica TaxID=13443 RepID=A0A6P6SEX2_COFAR
MEAPILLNLEKVPFLPKQVPAHDSIHWNSVIKHQAKLKNDRAILTTYAHMEALGILPNSTTLPLIFKACANLQTLERGKKIQNDMMGSPLINDIRVGTSLVDFYSKCGCLEDAYYVFDEMPKRDVIAWNAMILGCVQCMEYEAALFLFMEMQEENLRPNSRTVVSLLKACGELSELGLGKGIHGYCLRNGLMEMSSHVGSALISFYSRFDMTTANHVFRSLGSRSTVSWNSMLCGYFDAGHYLKTVDLFLWMLKGGKEYDHVTVLVIIQACAELGLIELGMQVHQLVKKHGFSKDLHTLNALMRFYSSMGYLKCSFNLFISVPNKDVVLWNSMISACIDNSLNDEAIKMFTKMQIEGIRPNDSSIISMINLFAGLEKGLTNGKSLHAYAIKYGMEAFTLCRIALLNMYGVLNCVEDALNIFSETNDSDVVSWNTLIAALVHNGLRSQVFLFFRQMQESDVKPNGHTIISILAACDDDTFLNTGRSFHGYVVKNGLEVDAALNAALTEMYMNCGDEANAKYLFEGFRNKDLISWNAMISNYVNNNRPQKALLLFHRMISEVEPNFSTIVSALSACAYLAELSQGLCLHAYITRRESLMGFHLPVANALITMYARCGCMRYAEYVFSSLRKRNSVSWNAIIAGYGMHGRGHDAVLAFSQMLEEGFLPTDVTFVSALSACSHSGLIEKGLQLYHLMVQHFYITPKLVHYACAVDLLSRGGRLDEAMQLIKSMPIAPDASVWRALLGACRVYSETSYAKIIFEKLVELEPTNAGNYILLSNVYAAAGHWSEVRKLRILLEKKGLVKPPGKSWIVVKNKLHQFTAGDKSHPESDKIYQKLSYLVSSIKRRGYVPDVCWVLHDEEPEEKLRRLLSHSEKLAIAFGLMNAGAKSPVLITKNLRVCGDCHEFSKHVSRLVGKEIILRDGSRFHHFSNGICSCKDYW